MKTNTIEKQKGTGAPAVTDTVGKIDGPGKKDFTRIFWPGTVETYGGRPARVYVKAEYKAGKLSLSGVVGPLYSGNCLGSCGQITDTVKELGAGKGTLAPDWTAEQVRALATIWDLYHLNDLSPACEHQRALHWDTVTASVTVTRTTYKRIYNGDREKVIDTARARIEKGALSGVTVKLTRAEKRALLIDALPYWVTTNNGARPKHGELYEQETEKTETKTLNWLSPDEHPDGLLGRACPVCGYKYGTAWKSYTVPASALKVLKGFPVVTMNTAPAWI